jgi:hypothetical protein
VDAKTLHLIRTTEENTVNESEIIQENFSLLRWSNGTHEALVDKVGGPSASKKLSDYVLGNDTPAPYERQSIEHKLNLPNGWTSRNNKALLELSEEDFALVSLVLRLDAKTRKALKAFASVASDT